MKESTIKRAARQMTPLLEITKENAIVNAFIGGAVWREEKAWNLASKRLPEIDREVIVLADVSKQMNKRPFEFKGTPCYMVCFAHRVNPKSTVNLNGQDLQPEGFGKGGWNIEGVKYWLDLELPIK